MIRRQDEMRTEMREKIRDGEGIIPTLHFLEAGDTQGKCRLCSLMTLEPGCSIGVHPHGPDAEIYYILEGELAATENGVETVLHCGDAMFTTGGDVHSVANNTDKTAKMLAIVIE